MEYIGGLEKCEIGKETLLGCIEMVGNGEKIFFKKFKLSQISPDSDLYFLEMETLFKLKSQKSDILKKIKEMEIHKVCLEQAK